MPARSAPRCDSPCPDRSRAACLGNPAPDRGVALRRLALAPLAALVLAALVMLLAPAPARADGRGIESAVAATLYLSDPADGAFLGSAFLWGDGDRALTNAHVVGALRRVAVRRADGTAVMAEVLAVDDGRDIAVLSVPGAGPGLQAGPAPRLGQAVWAVGAPMGLDLTLTRGIVSNLGRQTEAAVPLRLIQHDAAANPGSSGGPLVDDAGLLIGMNAQIADGSRLFIGVTYAIAAADLARLVPRLLAGDLPPVPDLGLALRSVDVRIAGALGLNDGEGLLVDDAPQGGIAHAAGLLPGDVILRAGERAMTRPGDLAFALEERAGDLLSLKVLRGRVLVMIDLDLAPPAAAFSTASAPAPVIASYTLAELGVMLDGTRIADLTETGPAWAAGLARGDRIMAVDGEGADGAFLSGLVLTRPALLRIARTGGETHVILDPWTRVRGFRPMGGANVLDPAVVLF